MGILEEGSVFDGRYAILGKLGAGGMATVYRALREDLDDPVALKVLSEDFLARNPREADRNLRRFKREAEILRLLDGARHVVDFVEHDCSESGDWFIAMEVLEGEQLRFYVGRGRNAMGIPTFLHLSTEILEGLKEIHAKHIIHRDLAPDNILVVKDENQLLLPKFLDFGIGKSVIGELDQVTQMVTIMGKPHYFSPEQARGQEQTSASDMYSMGVILYEMLTGNVPLRIRGVPDFRKIQRDPPEPVSNHPEASRVPRVIQDVIMSCLEKNAEDRPTLEDVLGSFREVQEQFNRGEITSTIQQPADEFPETTALDPGDIANASGETQISNVREGSGASTVSDVSDITLKSGDTISRYEIRSVLGRGGMGAVYLAWDPVLQREIAIKVATKIEEEQAKKAMLREARASSALRSENIVTIYDAGTDGGTPYIAMEYVSGPTLSEVIEEQGTLVGREFWNTARAIATGLKEAHERENPVIHRDLKPGNILLGKNATKITDFGIATVASSMTKGGTDTGAHGDTAGTAATMSPEQAEGGKSDHRSDIYSMGCVFYMMATGQSPFSGNAIAVLYQHCTATPRLPSKVNPSLQPAGLDDIILKCLQKAPDDRYQSAAEVLDDLRVLFKDTETVHIPWYRSRTGIATMILLLVALGVTGYLYATRGKPGPETFGFTLENLADLPFEPDRLLIYSKDPKLHILGQAEDGAANQLEVWFRTLDGSEEHKEVVAFKNEGEMDGAVDIPRDLLQGAGHGRLKISLRVEDDPEEPREICELAYDWVPPVIEWRNRGGPWQSLQQRTAQALRIEDVEFRIRDEGHGFQTGESALEVIRASRDMDFSQAGVTIKASAQQFEISGADRAGNPLSGFLIVETKKPEVTPRVTEPIRTRADEVELEVVVKTGSIDTSHERLTRLVAVSGEDDGPEASFAHKKDDLYVASLPLPDTGRPGVRSWKINLEYDGKLLAYAGGAVVEVIQDTQPPVITLKNRTGTWTNSETVPPQRYEKISEVLSFLKISVEDPGDLGALGTDPVLSVAFEIEGQRSEPETIRMLGLPVSLPPKLPEGDKVFWVILTARDAAGNQSELKFTLKVAGTRILPLASSGAQPKDGTLYVRKADGLEIKLGAGGLPEGSGLYVEVGSAQEDAANRKRHPMEKDASGNWVARDLPALADKPQRAYIYNTADKNPDFIAIYEFDLVPDRTAPVPSPTIAGLGRTWRVDQVLGHFPRIVIEIEDDIGMDVERTEVTCTPALVEKKTELQGRKLIVTFPQRTGAETKGKYNLSVVARDLAGNTAPAWSGSFEVVPPAISLRKIDNTLLEKAGTYEESPLYLKEPSVRLFVGNNAKVGNFQVQALTRKDGEQPQLQKTTTLIKHELSDLTLDVPGTRGEIQLQFAEVLRGGPVTTWRTFETIRYVVDRSQPEIVVLKNGTEVPRTALLEGLAVTSLKNIQIEVSDDLGLPEDPLTQAGRPAGQAGLVIESTTRKKVTYQLEHVATWDTLELDLQARDLASNLFVLQKFVISRALDRPILNKLTTASAKTFTLGRGPITLAETSFRISVAPAKDVLAVRTEVSRDGGTDTPRQIEFAQAGDSRPFLGEVSLDQDGVWRLAFSFKKGQEDWEEFAVQEIRLDTTPPAIAFLNLGRPVAGSTILEKSGNAVSAEVKDTVTGIGAVTCKLQGPGATRGRILKMGLARGGRYVIPLANEKPGSFSITVTAADSAGNSTSATLQVTIKAPAFDLAAITRRTGIKFVKLEDGGKKIGNPPLWMSKTEVTVGQFRRFHKEWSANPRKMVDTAKQDFRRPRLQRSSALADPQGDIHDIANYFNSDDADLPISRVTPGVAQLYCWWAGGRLPTLEEWRQAAGWSHKPGCEWPLYRDGNSWNSSRNILETKNGQWSKFSMGGRTDQPIPVSRLSSLSPFGLSGIAGNVAEYVTIRNSSFGSMGGSFKYSHTDPGTGARIGIDPRTTRRTPQGCNDVGIRVVLDPKGR